MAWPSGREADPKRSSASPQPRRSDDRGASPDDCKESLRIIPSVDELLGRTAVQDLQLRAGRGLVLEAIRVTLADLRAKLRAEPSPAAQAQWVSWRSLEQAIAQRVDQTLSCSLRPVINATGVILHTNLGRAPLPAAVMERLAAVAAQYSNLEYELASGVRGKRDVHIARWLTQLLRCEAAIVVNNNAAAVFLVLNTLAKNGEVIVSRGELIEIGDGFRIPEIMAESGAVLLEVGTTNRTRIADYERAINERTRLLLRVHPSNFRVVGFTERPTLGQMIDLARRHNLPLFEDLGSGCLADLAEQGLEEPTAEASIAAGAEVISFSGDKLLGGPQAGIIAGRQATVERIRRNPLFRALRVDKLTIAALEVTLQTYLRERLDDIPVLRMARAPMAEVRRRAQIFAASLRAQAGLSCQMEISKGESLLGGGATPDQKIPTALVRLQSSRHSAAELESSLRKPASGTPVVARIERDWLVLDLRTVFAEQEPQLLATVLAALAG